MSVDVWADSIQTAALLFAAGAAALAYRQVALARHGGGGANVLDLWALLQSRDARADRRRVYEAVEANGPFDSNEPGCWPEEAREAASSVAQLWSVAGALAARDILPVDLIVDEWNGVLRRTWTLCEPVVIYERRRRDIPLLYSSFEWLADQAVARPPSDLRSRHD